MAEGEDGVGWRIEHASPPPRSDLAIRSEGCRGLKSQGAALQIRLIRLNQDLHKIETTLRQIASRKL